MWVFLPWPTHSSEYPTTYDGAIQTAAETWWPDLPQWRLLKAQYWQESRLDPKARSNVGASGVAQFMPRSWADVIHALKWPDDVSAEDADYAIEGGAWYDAKLRRSWKGRAALDSHDLALASYNAGIGNVLKAQKLCDDARLWAEIAPCFGSVTGAENARQTTEYVSKTHRWWREMEK